MKRNQKYSTLFIIDSDDDDISDIEFLEEK